MPAPTPVLDRGAADRAPGAGRSAWLPPADELALYEAIREGNGGAFTALAGPLQPVLERLAGLTSPSHEQGRAIVAQAWARSLGALDMFTWHTSFAAWVARAAVSVGRASPRHRPKAPRSPSYLSIGVPAPGPWDWVDLPWSARWEPAIPVLADALAALPLPVREAIHASDVERWPTQRACDVLSLTVAAYERLRDRGHRHLHDALARFVGEPPNVAALEQRIPHIAAGVRLVQGSRERSDPRPDPATLAVFHAWRRRDESRWSELGSRIRKTGSEVVEAWYPGRRTVPLQA